MIGKRLILTHGQEDCDGDVAIQSIYLATDRRMVVHGTCLKCLTTVQFVHKLAVLARLCPSKPKIFSDAEFLKSLGIEGEPQ